MGSSSLYQSVTKIRDDILSTADLVAVCNCLHKTVAGHISKFFGRKHVFAYFLLHVCLWIILDGARNIPIFNPYLRQHYRKIKLQFGVLKLTKRKRIATHINNCDDVMAKGGAFENVHSYKKLKHLHIFAHWNLPCGVSAGKKIRTFTAMFTAFVY